MSCSLICFPTSPRKHPSASGNGTTGSAAPLLPSAARHGGSKGTHRDLAGGQHGHRHFLLACMGQSAWSCPPLMGNVHFWAVSTSLAGLLILSSTLESLFWHFQGSKKYLYLLYIYIYPDIYTKHGKVSLKLVFLEPFLLPAGFGFRTLAPDQAVDQEQLV